MSILAKLLCYPRVSPIRKGFNLCVSIHHSTDVATLKLAADAGFAYAGVDALDGIGNAKEVEAAVTAACDKAGLQMIGQQGRDTKWGSAVWGHATINEPNSTRFWTGGPAALVERYRALRRQDAGRPVIGGNLTDLNSCRPEAWIKDLWRLGANECWDYIGIHVYADAGKETISRYDELAKMYRLAGFRQPFWMSEFGFNRNKAFVSDEKIARWTTWVLSKLSRKADCMGANLYELYGDDRYGFSLIDRATGTARPVLDRIREARQ